MRCPSSPSGYWPTVLSSNRPIASTVARCPRSARYPSSLATRAARTKWAIGSIKQFQLDGLGEVLLLFAAAGRHDHLDKAHWPAVEAAVAAIEDRWNEPDAGVWEIDNQHWAHSRLTCVAGLKAIVAQAPASQGGAWSALADTILADVAEGLRPSKWPLAALPRR